MKKFVILSLIITGMITGITVSPAISSSIGFSEQFYGYGDSDYAAWTSPGNGTVNISGYADSYGSTALYILIIPEASVSLAESGYNSHGTGNFLNSNTLLLFNGSANEIYFGSGPWPYYPINAVSLDNISVSTGDVIVVLMVSELYAVFPVQANLNIAFTAGPNPVPIPGSALLFFPCVVSLVAIRRRFNKGGLMGLMVSATGQI